MILLLFLFGLALGAVTPPDDHEVKLQRRNCPMFWYSFNGRCYKYISTRMNWADAEFYCVSQGANLVSIHSTDEHNFVNSLIRNFDPARTWTWIGFSDLHKEGRWMWSDGSKVNFDFWATGQPDNFIGHQDCGVTSWGKGFKWDDQRCSETRSFVCASRIFCP